MYFVAMYLMKIVRPNINDFVVACLKNVLHYKNVLKRFLIKRQY